MKELTPSEKVWVEQMRARVPKFMAQGMTLDQAVKLAHNELQAFIGAMVYPEGCYQKERAQRAFKMLSADVWRRCQIMEINRRAVNHALSD